jgi:predicted cobalt transporter CbtA
MLPATGASADGMPLLTALGFALMLAGITAIGAARRARRV